ncbi:hypothetical protein [Antarcticirhabdus aurantiaca]|uniref:Uncharacterized protein n=1 Tax=Antarcticirhabdus aurantiaca TaxID=2606717 RepID=A0ACD4NKU0_9HYPH|nr:hypothetical protein OXU80_22165 [Jeongeuplla avenae]
MGLRDINRQDKKGCRVWRIWSGFNDEVVSEHERLVDAREAYEAAKIRWPEGVFELRTGAHVVQRSDQEGERADLAWCRANLPWMFR